MNGPAVTETMRPSCTRTRKPLSPISTRKVVSTCWPRRTRWVSAFTRSASFSIMLSSLLRPGRARNAVSSCQPYQRIHRDNADLLYDQRVDLGLHDRRLAREPRECDDGLRERVEIAFGPAAVAGERNERAHVADHLMR